MKDPEFLADAGQANLYLNPVEGSDIEGFVAQILRVNPDDKAALNFLVNVQ